ncbi:hypothetical protein H2201_000182 [Coniosporium apollinis]|uniref:C2H2-type domain-containing protein n=2 Tax=Coniosporium TaxID=2810619 RepID=A0ABQ9P5D2_9PEZI|nr:hypothetical protein H2199_008177 [Cladosporium sp. JES 115]KAJ9669796.1 hypothetical protein H2201_000182 [Coniosporium apollinis]
MPPSQEQEPIHVVGQQGRRGVLPNATGRPLPGSGKAALVPTKDAEGKYTCPNCTKTYLHLKHLKRHLLRHTGERPYQCRLCKDTFSRSDILKRHFQKCSIRRGNPTGESHLADSQSHLKKNRLSTGSVSDMSLTNNITTSTAYSDGTFANAFTSLPPLTASSNTYVEPLPSMSTRTSRSNSLMRPGTGVGNENRRSMSDMNIAGRNIFDLGPEYRPATTLGDISQGMSAYGMTQAQSAGHISQPFAYNASGTGSDLHSSLGLKSEDSNPLLYGRPSIAGTGTLQEGQGNALQWPSPFQTNVQDGFMAPTSMSAGPGTTKAASTLTNNFQSHNGMSQDGMFDSLYTGTASFGGDQIFETWDVDSSLNKDPLQAKADALLDFAFSGQNALAPHTDDSNYQALKAILTVDNIRHFLDQFKNFQGHWPMIHLPTFNPIQANNGLVLTIICIGAVYSERIDAQQVRSFMEVVKSAVHRTSNLYALASEATTEPDALLQQQPSDIEEIQTLFLLSCLFIWHGNEVHRRMAREEFPKVARVVSRIGLLRPAEYGQPGTLLSSHPGYSVLHQPGPIPDSHELSAWSWAAWVEQEKRLRIVYLVFLIDAAMVIFFNSIPQFNAADVRLPLPSDDAPWEAKNAADCANALGLNGSDAQYKNITGSRALKQPDMRQIMSSILQSDGEFESHRTNVYGKFILIHALHVQIWHIQRRASQQVAPVPSTTAFSPGGGSAPLLKNAWSSANGASGTMGKNSSGYASPMEPYGQDAHQMHKALNSALEKWKKTWDRDMDLQYPSSQPVLRRVGFCRDGIHFYYLATHFLRSTRAADWHAHPDVRFRQVFSLLRQIKTHLATKQPFGSGEIGAVGDIREDYGMEGLTLNMKHLFTPIAPHVELPGLQAAGLTI